MPGKMTVEECAVHLPSLRDCNDVVRPKKKGIIMPRELIICQHMSIERHNRELVRLCLAEPLASSAGRAI